MRKKSDKELIEEERRGIEASKREIEYFKSTLPMSNYTEANHPAIQLFRGRIAERQSVIDEIWGLGRRRPGD